MGRGEGRDHIEPYALARRVNFILSVMGRLYKILNQETAVIPSLLHFVFYDHKGKKKVTMCFMAKYDIHFVFHGREILRELKGLPNMIFFNLSVGEQRSLLLFVST